MVVAAAGQQVSVGREFDAVDRLIMALQFLKKCCRREAVVDGERPDPNEIVRASCGECPAVRMDVDGKNRLCMVLEMPSDLQCLNVHGPGERKGVEGMDTRTHRHTDRWRPDRGKAADGGDLPFVGVGRAWAGGGEKGKGPLLRRGRGGRAWSKDEKGRAAVASARSKARSPNTDFAACASQGQVMPTPQADSILLRPRKGPPARQHFPCFLAAWLQTGMPLPSHAMSETVFESLSSAMLDACADLNTRSLARLRSQIDAVALLATSPDDVRRLDEFRQRFLNLRDEYRRNKARTELIGDDRGVAARQHAALATNMRQMATLERLERLRTMLVQELEKTSTSSQSLEKSSNLLSRSTEEHLRVYEHALRGATSILRSIQRRQITDSVLLAFGWLVFIGTIVFVLSKRIHIFG